MLKFPKTKGKLHFHAPIRAHVFDAIDLDNSSLTDKQDFLMSICLSVGCSIVYSQPYIILLGALPLIVTAGRRIVFAIAKHSLQVSTYSEYFKRIRFFYCLQGWEFIKEKKKVNMHASTQKRTRSRKHALGHANTHSYKKASTQKRTRTRKHARKHALVQESVHEKKNPLKKKR